MKKFLILFLVCTVAFSFTGKLEEDANCNEETFMCTSPGTAFVPVTNTDNSNYFTASTSTSIFNYADGYEWEVTGGFIISGQGTGTINIGIDCPVPNNLEICVRAYNQDGFDICYSSEVCTSVVYTGRCFLIFGGGFGGF
jgi:hypothetical protein